MSRQGSRVPPLSSAIIEAKAIYVRQALELDDYPMFPVIQVAENIVGDCFEIGSIEEMGPNEGLTYPDLGEMVIREDVYEAAIRGEGRARFTIAHELGHLFLHRATAYARSEAGIITKLYENSEWQADEFAGNLLAPIHHIRGLTAAQTATRCGLSLPAAIVRINKIKHR